MPTTWNGEPLPPPELAKPSERLAVKKKKADAVKTLTRRQVVAKVWLREKGKCQRCGKQCKGPRETYPTDPDRGEVHEDPPRSLGGDPLNPAQCVLLCFACHHARPSGGHIGRKTSRAQDTAPKQTERTAK